MPITHRATAPLRGLLALAVVLALLAVTVTVSVAAPAAPGRGTHTVAQEVGDTVPLLSVDGDEEGGFTVTDVTDDFEDLEESISDEERVVSVDVEVEADGADIAVDPESFNIVDDRGFGWVDVDVARTDGKESLEAGELADGESVSGSLEIVVPADAEIRKLLYIVDDERVLTLLDAGVEVGPGDPVTLYDEGYEETGTITVDDVVEEFDDLEDGAEPEAGGMYYGLVVTIENTGTAPIDVDPEAFRAIDANGVAWLTEPIDRGADSLDQVPDLEAGDLPEGDSVTGFVGFVVFEDVALDYVAYVPDIRIYPILDEAAGGQPGDDRDTPAANGEDTPEAEADDPAEEEAAAADCEGLAVWFEATVANVDARTAALDRLGPESVAEDLRFIASEMEAIAAAQAGLATPPAAQEAQNLIVAAFQDTAASLYAAANALDAFDDSALEQAVAQVDAITTSLDEGGEISTAIDDLLATCDA